MKASDLKSEGNISFLFKGPFGFGKTLSAASFALDGPLYLSYWDKKSPIELVTYFTKKRFGDLAERILDNITYDVYGSNNAGDYLNKLLQLREDCRYTTIVNDSTTFMTAAAVHWSQNFGKRGNIEQKIKDMKPDWDEYKVETNLVSQCIDVSRNLPCNVIWTAHPIPTVSLSGSGGSMRVNKINSIVSYGSKVAGIIPGSFTEIYHFSQQSNFSSDGKSNKRYIVNTQASGDDFAKSPLLGDTVSEFDITDQLFYSVWKELLNKSRGIETITDVNNPFKNNVQNNSTEQPTTATKWRV